MELSNKHFFNLILMRIAIILYLESREICIVIISTLTEIVERNIVLTGFGVSVRA
jgi:hypothetical protein